MHPNQNFGKWGNAPLEYPNREMQNSSQSTSSSKTSAYSPVSVFVTAFCSRCIVLFLIVLLQYLLPDHVPQGAYDLPINWTNESLKNILVGFIRWDSAHFLAVSKWGYGYSEQSLAFFPLYPILVSIVSKSTYILVSSVMSSDEWMIFCAVAISNISFAIAAVILWLWVSSISVSQNTRFFTLVLFLVNPSNVFFSIPYAESFFSMLWFSTVYALQLALPHKCSILGGIKLSGVCLFLFLAASTRSNGLFAIVLVVFSLARDVLLDCWNRYEYAWSICWHFMMILCALLPYALANIRAAMIVCSGWQLPLPAVCSEWIPQVYSYVEMKYWNVGFLNYYEARQIVNIAIAMPVFVAALSVIQWFVTEECPNVLDLILYHPLGGHCFHLIITLTICALVAHLPTTTRVICSSSPFFYYGIASVIANDKAATRHGDDVQLSRIHWTVYWGLTYTFIGIAGHVNALPWT